jgi:MSHA pilin protein MshA
MVHGKFLVQATQPATMTLEGQNVNIVNGYPQADTDFAKAAGLYDDYTVVGPGLAATASLPKTNADEIAIVPKSVASSPTGLKCYVLYKQAAANSAPTITLKPANSGDCE